MEGPSPLPVEARGWPGGRAGDPGAARKVANMPVSLRSELELARATLAGSIGADTLTPTGVMSY